MDNYQKAREALNYISPDLPRDDWLKTATALKNEFGDTGFDMFDDWSRGGQSYQNASVKAVWKSARGSAPDIGWLFKVAMANGYKPEKVQMSDEDKATLDAQRQQNNAQRLDREQRELAEEHEWHERVAVFCRELLLPRLKAVGSSKYLGLKKIKSFGISFVGQPFGVLVDDNNQSLTILETREDCSTYFKKENRHDHLWFLYLKRGTIAIPLLDTDLSIHNFQFIFAAGAKKFMKHGRKKGLFYRFGDFSPSCERPLVFGEGYATLASCHMATDYPCVVTFDCGNLVTVAQRFADEDILGPLQKIIVAGDDDPNTKGNPGRVAAEQAAKILGGVAAFPKFAEVVNG